jgi:parallel beta-helix repeat protein
LGKGVLIYDSEDVTLDGNVIHDFYTWGIHADESKRLVINNNVINGIKTENIWHRYGGRWHEYGGGLNIGNSTDFIVTNNIVASTDVTGFMLPAYQCEGIQVHFGNVAHSIGGNGVIVQRPEKTEDCLEFSGFKGYKTRLAVVHMGGDLGAYTNKIRDIVAIDAGFGLMAFLPNSGDVEVSNSIFYGDHQIGIHDCYGADCGRCITKHGLMIPVYGNDENFDAGESWGGFSVMKDNKFIGF